MYFNFIKIKKYFFIFSVIFLFYLIYNIKLISFSANNYLKDFEYNIEYSKNIDLDNKNFIQIKTFLLKEKKYYNLSNIEISLFYDNELIYKTKTLNNGLALINLNKELFNKLNKKIDLNKLKFLELNLKIGDYKEKLYFNIVKNYKALIVLDKPLYQPGQEVFIKIITLKQKDNIFKPINDYFILEIIDPKGNKLEYKQVKTDEFGTLFFKYNLSSLINLGTYKVNLKKDNEIIATTNFEVDKYNLPKFKIELNTDSNYFVINRDYKIKLNLNYFFGKPVEADLNIDVYSFDAEFYKIYSINSKTNKNGEYIFNLKVPNYLTGIDKNKGLIKITVTAKDKADQVETKDFIFNVYSKDIISDIVSENQLVKGIENKFLCVFYYPESTNFDNNFKVIFYKPFKKVFETKGNSLSFYFKSNDDYINFDYDVVDLNKNIKVNFKKTLYQDQNNDNFLFLDLEKVLYKVGDKVNFSIFLNSKEDVYIQVYLKTDSGFVSLLSDTVNVDKKANYSFVLNTVGNLFIRAYYIDSKGYFVDDIKSIISNPNDNFKILAKTDKNIYKPKDNLILKINTYLNNNEVDSKVLIDIVDESVLYLANKTPELLKLYLTLVKELLTPKYEVHNYIDFIINQQNNLLKYSLLKDYNNILKNEINSNLQEVNSIQRKDEITFNNAQKLYEKIYNYYYKFKAIPDSLIKLFGNVDYIYDGWNNIFKIELNDNVIEIRSAGIDKVFNTSDDIVYPDDFVKFKEFVEFKEFGNRILTKAPVQKSNILRATSDSETSFNSNNFSIRQYFPETFYSNIIDSNKSINLKLPDSITNWKVSLLAIDKQGNITNNTLDIKVFQEFFIDVNLPLFLTKNDEISIPVIVYNYTKDKLKVNLVIQKDDWFELLDNNQKSIVIDPNGVNKLYFRIRATKVGKNDLVIFAYSNNLKDAIKKQIEVIPYGRYVQNIESFSGSGNFNFEVKGEGKGAYLVVYPVLFSQVLSGLDNMLNMPYGCFEQTSSVNYPNVLILKYLKQKGITNPSITMKANYYISIGYQRLLTFEVDGGGFSWFGDKPANKVLTAFGLREFKDMKDIIFVDENLIKRTKEFLLNNQLDDGSWEPDKSYLHQETWKSIQQSKLTTTAYILDSLLENDKDILNNSKIQKSIDFILNNTKNIKQIDNYTLSFIFNSLINYVLGNNQKVDNNVLNKIKEIKQELINRVRTTNNDELFFEGINQGSLFYGDFNTSSIEITANIALAFIKLSKLNIKEISDNSDINKAYKMIKFLINSKSENGLWYSTQPTVMSLKAIYYFDLYSTSFNQDKNITININNLKDIDIKFSKDDLAYKIVDLNNYLKDGKNYIDIKGNELFYDLVYYQYVDFDKDFKNIKDLDFLVNYDRTKVKENDIITVNVKIKKLTNRVLQMVVLDLGIPPGFSVITDKLDILKQKGIIKNYELTYNQIIIYFDKIEKDIEFSYEIKANYPLKVRVLSSKVYEYYKPSNKLEKFGGVLEVK
ncbi:MAG: alpha-2-macroglobulin family protein [bacterium]